MAKVGYGSRRSKIASVQVRCCWVSGLLKLVMGLVEIGVGHEDQHGTRRGQCFQVSIVRLGFCWRVRCCQVFVVTLVFFFFFLIFFFNMGFCSSGILVGSRQWWHGGHGGGAVVVTRQWRRSDKGRRKVEEQKRKNIFYCINILF